MTNDAGSTAICATRPACTVLPPQMLPARLSPYTRKSKSNPVAGASTVVKVHVRVPASPLPATSVIRVDRVTV